MAKKEHVGGLVLEMIAQGREVGSRPRGDTTEEAESS